MDERPSTLARLALLIFLMVGVLALWRPFESVPLILWDSVEYFTSAENLVSGDGLQIRLRGEFHPTRYPPGFPVLFLAPWYLFFGVGNPAVAICSIILAALGALFFCWRICRFVLPGAAGIASAFVCQLLVLKLVQFERLSGLIMSDIPLLFLSLGALVAFLKCLESPKIGWYALGGLTVAVAVSMRLTNLALCLPFLIPLARTTGRRELRFFLASFSIPIFAGLAVLLLYNHSTFGSPTFTGYHYWLPTRAFYPALRHFPGSAWEMLHPLNLPHLRKTPIDWWIGPAFLTMPLLSGTVCRKWRPVVWARTKPIVRFLFTYGLPTIAFFSFFHFADARFVLPLHVLWLCLGALWACSILKQYSARWSLGVVALSAALTLTWHLGTNNRQRPYADALMESMNAHLPENAVIVGTLPELAADRFLLRDTARRYIPLTKLKSLENWRWGVGKSNEQRRKVGVASATTMPEQLDELLTQGRPVYVISQYSRWTGRSRELDALLARFEQAPALELRPRDVVELLPARNSPVP